MIVEEGAGMNAQFKDSDYLEAGAQIKPLKDMYSNSDIIIKVLYCSVLLIQTLIDTNFNL